MQTICLNFADFLVKLKKKKESKTKTKNKQTITQFDETLMLLNQVSFVEQTKFCYKRDRHNHCKNPEHLKLPS